MAQTGDEDAVRRLQKIDERESIQSSNGAIIKALEKRRIEMNVSKRMFSNLLLMGNSHYIEVLNGKKRVSLESRIAAHKLGVPADVLLSGIW